MLSILAVGAVCLGCRGTALAYGPDVASARANGDALLLALEHRFTNVLRTPKFAKARMRIAGYALAPSKLENDTALWTGRLGSSGATRELLLDGSMVGPRYTFIARKEVPIPLHVGDSRHAIRLSPLGDDDYQWVTEVDHNIGTLPPLRAGELLTALFAAAERPDATIRSDYRGAFPHAVESWGRLFALDSIRTIPLADGSTRVELQITLDPTRLRLSMPALARYVERYVSEGRSHVLLRDRAGGVWFDILGDRSNKMLVRFRSRHGSLQPWDGPAKPMPDTLKILVDMRTKLSVFTVGVVGMEGEFVQVSTSTERGWALRFTTEPEWRLPPTVHLLLKSPLRRPFEGTGMVLRVGFRTGPAGQTLLSRAFAVAVRESTIMRILGNLGFTAMDDFAGAVESEENRFLAEGFSALRADLKSVLGAD